MSPTSVTGIINSSSTFTLYTLYVNGTDHGVFTQNGPAPSTNNIIIQLFFLHHPYLSIKDGWKLLDTSVHYVLLRIVCCDFHCQLNCCGINLQTLVEGMDNGIMQWQYSKSFGYLSWYDSSWMPWVYINIILMLLVQFNWIVTGIFLQGVTGMPFTVLGLIVEGSKLSLCWPRYFKYSIPAAEISTPESGNTSSYILSPYIKVDILTVVIGTGSVLITLTLCNWTWLFVSPSCDRTQMVAIGWHMVW